MLTDNNWLLSVITFVPLVGAAIVMLIPKAEEQLIKMTALVTSFAALGLGIYMLLAFDYDAGFTEDGRFAGQLKPTGIRPMFSDRLEQQGIKLSGDVFGDGLAVLGNEGGW